MRPSPRDSTTKRHSRWTSRRTKSPLAGPSREVVYIFEREGERGGGYWWLVLACGHAVARRRHVPSGPKAMAYMMFRPLSEKCAPKAVQCHWCGTGTAPHDPWATVKMFGGPTP